MCKVVLANSQKQAVSIKHKVWELTALSHGRLLALPGTDKTIAHTIGYVGSQYWLYKS